MDRSGSFDSYWIEPIMRRHPWAAAKRAENETSDAGKRELLIRMRCIGASVTSRLVYLAVTV